MKTHLLFKGACLRILCHYIMQRLHTDVDDATEFVLDHTVNKQGLLIISNDDSYYFLIWLLMGQPFWLSSRGREIERDLSIEAHFNLQQEQQVSKQSRLNLGITEHDELSVRKHMAVQKKVSMPSITSCHYAHVHTALSW